MLLSIISVLLVIFYALEQCKLFNCCTLTVHLLVMLIKQILQITSEDKPNGLGTSKVSSELQHISSNDQLDGNSVDRIKLLQLSNDTEDIGLRNLLQSQNEETTGLFRKMKQEDVPPSVGEVGNTYFSNFNQGSNGTAKAAKAEFRKANILSNDIYEAPPHTNLTMTLGAPLGHSNTLPGAIVDEREHSKASSMFLQGARSRHLLPKPPRSTVGTSLEANTGMASQVRVARPPAEGRGRNQLLPRYWPRITDQELQQISGEYPYFFSFYSYLFPLESRTIN